MHYCIKSLAWAWSEVTKECMNGTWEKTHTRFIHNFKGFVKMRSLRKISKAVVDITNNANLGVDENDLEKFLEMVPAELIGEELLKLKEKCTAEKAREKETSGEKRKKKRTYKKIHSEGIS